MPGLSSPPLSSRGLTARLRQFFYRLLSLRRRTAQDDDLQTELQTHLALQTDEYRRQGMSPEEARRAARLRLGGFDQIREEVRDQRGLSRLEGLLQDGGYALRLLRRQPLFTITAILTLALGIGANTAIFSIVDSLLVRPLPYANAQQIVSVQRGLPHGGREDGLSASAFRFLRDHSRAFSSVAAANDYGSGMNLGGIAHPARIIVASATHEFFPLLQVHPALGRLFTAQDDRDGGAHVAVLSDALWRSQFGAAPSVLGRSIHLDGELYTVIGVLPRSFSFWTPAEAWLPLDPASSAATNLGPNLDVLARLRSGITLQQARAEMALLSPRYVGRRTHVYFDHFLLLPEQAAVFGEARPWFLLLSVAVALVLLIACANLANLLLSRGATRRKELAVRAALGASRIRIARQLLTESVLLSLFGGLAGLGVAWLTLPLLLQLAPANAPFLNQVGLHLPVLGFTLVAALVAGLLFGVLPAWHLSHLPLNEELKLDGNTVTASRSHQRTGNLLVVGEITLAFLLLVAAASLLQTLLHDQRATPGLDPHQVLTVQTSLPAARQASAAATEQYVEQVLRKLRALPGVTSAAAVSDVPLRRALNDGAQLPGQDAHAITSDWRAVSPGYFQTLRIPLLAGRAFSDADHAGALPVAIVNCTFAEHFWPKQNPVGQQIEMGGRLNVIGVVADVKNHGLDQPTAPELYVPQAQASNGMNKLTTQWFPYAFVLRTKVPPLRLAHAVKQALLAVDPDQPGFDLATLEQVGGASLQTDQFLASLLSIFAGLALALGMVGIYGVVAGRVAQRQREIGIRMIMGATRRTILGSVLGHALRLVGAGILLGVIGVVALNRVFASAIGVLQPLSPGLLAAIALLLLLEGLVASYAPARRALQTDPAAILHGS